ncbi:hypothetical protein [Candidatus Methylomirabilis sp.]|uniref:hypothetical protein n=1 Tax=Candidatus Methylomirabilis sp. TaxID=2032687 RepID=UPI0030764C92
MAFKTGLGVTNNVKGRIRIYALWFMATCFALVAPSPLLSFAWSGFPCEDVNNNGACDPGEPDITAHLLSAGSFYTSESIVIPAGVKGLITPAYVDLSLMAEKNITLNSNLIAKNASIFIFAGGTITIGDKTTLRAGGDSVMLDARGDIVLRVQASLLADQRANGRVYLFSEEGSLLLMQKSRLIAKDSADLQALQGVIAVNRGSTLNARSVSVHAAGDVTVNGSLLKVGSWLEVETWAHLLDFQQNMVQFMSYESSAYLITGGSTVNISGTVFKNLSPDDLIIQAGQVIQ